MQAYPKGFNPDYQEQAPTIEQVSALAGHVILEFGAPWCEHCQVAAPSVKEVLSKLELPHIKVFDGKGKSLGRSFKVKLWPTLILLNNGQEVARVVRPLNTSDVQGLLAHMEV